MINQELDFLELKNQFIQYLDKQKTIVLATGSSDRITARSISYVNIDIEVFFLTSVKHTKYIQILDNPNVALCLGALQMEGRSTIKGHPFDENNEQYLTLYKQKHPNYYEKFAKKPETTIVSVYPHKATLLTSIEGDYYLNKLDIEKNTAYKEPFTQK